MRSAAAACLVLAAQTCHAFMPTAPGLVTAPGRLHATRHISGGSRLALSPRSPPETRRLRTSLTAVAPEVGDVLSRYGVDEGKHEELIAELAPLLSKAAAPKKKIGKVDAEVSRSETGSLGIDVDQDNVVRKNSGQPNLKVGDRITAVDGVPVTGAVAGFITPGKATYTFTVERGIEEASSLENQIVLLASDEEMYTRGAGLAMLDPLKGPTAGGFLKAAEDLEELGLDVDTEKMKGFWRLVWTNDLEFVPKGGLSELGSMPYCVLAAHLQCYQDKDPSLQTVEVVANMNTGSHALASVKGSFVVGEQGKSGGVDGRAVTEQYTRLEFASSPQSYSRTEKACVVTYAGNKVRLARRASQAVPGKDGKVTAGQGLFIYIKRSPQEVGGEMQAWLDKPVVGGGGKRTTTRWEGASKDRGQQGGQSMLRD